MVRSLHGRWWLKAPAEGLNVRSAGLTWALGNITSMDVALAWSPMALPGQRFASLRISGQFAVWVSTVHVGARYALRTLTGRMTMNIDVHALLSSAQIHVEPFSGDRLIVFRDGRQITIASHEWGTVPLAELILERVRVSTCAQCGVELLDGEELVCCSCESCQVVSLLRIRAELGVA